MVFVKVSGEIVNFENLVDLKKLKQLDETQSSAHRDFVISFKYFKKETEISIERKMFTNQPDFLRF